MNWMPLKNWEDLPVGVWLVAFEGRDTVKHEVAVHVGALIIVGGLFHYDQGPPLAYAEFEKYKEFKRVGVLA